MQKRVKPGHSEVYNAHGRGDLVSCTEIDTVNEAEIAVGLEHNCSPLHRNNDSLSQRFLTPLSLHLYLLKNSSTFVHAHCVAIQTKLSGLIDQCGSSLSHHSACEHMPSAVM